MDLRALAEERRKRYAQFHQEEEARLQRYKQLTEILDELNAEFKKFNTSLKKKLDRCYRDNFQVNIVQRLRRQISALKGQYITLDEILFTIERVKLILENFLKQQKICPEEIQEEINNMIDWNQAQSLVSEFPEHEANLNQLKIKIQEILLAQVQEFETQQAKEVKALVYQYFEQLISTVNQRQFIFTKADMEMLEKIKAAFKELFKEVLAVDIQLNMDTSGDEAYARRLQADFNRGQM